MVRRPALVVALAAALLAAAPATGDNSGKIAALNAKIAWAQRHESKLNAQIATATSQIRRLERNVQGVAQRLAPLERDLALHQNRLNKLNALYTFETQRLVFLRRLYTRVLHVLDRRLVELYEGRAPTTFDVIVDAKSIQEAVDELHYLNAIALQDKRITRDVGVARDEMVVVRGRTQKIRVVVQTETQVVKVRTQEEEQLRDRLLVSQHGLASTRTSRQRALAATRLQEKNWLAEAQTLARNDARVRAQLTAPQGQYTGAPSSHGLIWPVNGPITSPFGMRWGVLHPGIDIGVPTGTPIHAAASGTVAIAGWVDGYGNYTCINHGGGLSTCYAHQETIYVSVGQHVTQGQVIGLVDCTGYCFGPHLHFEVRVNGTPVDPMGYLG